MFSPHRTLSHAIDSLMVVMAGEWRMRGGGYEREGKLHTDRVEDRVESSTTVSLYAILASSKSGQRH